MKLRFTLLATAAMLCASGAFAQNPLYQHPAGQITAQVVSCYPPQNYTHFAGDSLTITFAAGTPIVAASLTDSTFVVQAQQSGWHQGVAAYDSATNTITFTPAKPFFAGELVTAVATWKILYDSAGIAVPIHGFAWQFYAAVAKHTRATFRDTVHFYPGGITILSALADMTGTGNLDILYDHVPGSIVAFNSGDGIHYQNTVLNQTRLLYPADYKLRGWQDVLVGYDSAFLEINNGDRTFDQKKLRLSAPFNNGGVTNSIVDLNFSGKPEIVTEGWDGSMFDTVIIYSFDGDSIVRRQAMYVGMIGTGPLAVADWNNDGALDVGTYITGDYPFTNASLSIMYNDGTGKLLPPVSVLPHGAGELAADLDGDGLVDWIGMTGQGVEIDHNNGDGTFTPIESPDRFNAERTGIAIGDCDGDGQLDVVYNVDVWPQQLDSMFLVTAKNVGNDKVHVTQDIIEGQNLGEFAYIYLGDLDHSGSLGAAVSFGEAGVIAILENDSSVSPISVVEKPVTTPDGYALNETFPNPANNIANITYTMPSPKNVTIALYNEMGQLITTLVHGLVDGGTSTVTYDCSNLMSGIYFVRLVSFPVILTKSFIHLA